MTSTRPSRLVRPLLLLGLLMPTVVGLPFAGKWLRRQDDRCAYDGLAIEPIYRVRIVDGATSRVFCCVGCARAWLDRQPPLPDPPGDAMTGSLRFPVFVTDENSGQEIASHSAFFVLSPISTNPITGNRTHVFFARQEAQSHASAFRGRILDGPRRPFWDAEQGPGHVPPVPVSPFLAGEGESR